jgi:4-hydroxy-tetrahydrodipicolinate synthase
MRALHGIVPPLVTPLDASGDVDTRSSHRLVDYLLDAGVHGLFVLGSSGEAASLDSDERAAVIRTVVEAARGRVPVLVGVSDTAPRRILRHIGMAAELRADAVVASPPYYYVSSQAEIEEFFRALSQKSTLPVIAYNIPALVKVGIEAGTVYRLAQEGVIRALKDSSADLSATREVFLQVKQLPSFAVLTGLEFAVDAALAMGLHGAVPGLGNVAPRHYVEIYDAVQGAELDRARALQERLISLFRITRQGLRGQSHSGAALAGFKAALKLLGVIATSRTHEPLQGLTETEEERVKAVMEETGLL